MVALFSDQFANESALLFDGDAHTETEFRVVFEEGVAPRRTIAFRVGRVRRRREVRAVNGGATGSVRDKHAIAEELRYEFNVRRFAATRARAREFEERQKELRSLDARDVDLGTIVIGKAEEVIPRLAFGFEMLELVLKVDRLLAFDFLVLRRADVGAHTATGAVVGSDLNREFLTGEFFRFGVDGFEAFGSALRGIVNFDTNRGVRTDERAVAALDTDVRIPDRNIDRDRALFVLRRARGERAVRGGEHVFDGEFFAAIAEDFAQDVLDEFRSVAVDARFAMEGGGNFRRNRDFLERVERGVDRLEVLFDDFGTLLAVDLLDTGLNALDTFVDGHEVAELEEAGFHDGVDATAHAGVLRDGDGVDDVELQFLGDDILLQFDREVIPNFVGAIRGVEKEDAAFDDVAKHVELLGEDELVTRDEIRGVDQIGALDRARREAQVRDRDRAGLLGVVNEVTLAVVRGVFADDLRCFFVRADGSVATKTVEDAATNVVGFGIVVRIVFDARIGDVVFDTDGEVVLDGSVGHRFVEAFDHRGGEVFGSESETTAVDFGHDAFPFLSHGGDDVVIEGFAGRAGFFGAVEDGDLLDGFGERADERGGGERTIEADVQETDLLVHPDRVKVFFNDTRAATDNDDDRFGVRIADVVEDVILTTGEGGEFVHRFLNDTGNGVVRRVASFARLEEDVGVLRGSAHDRVRRIEGAVAELLDEIEIDHRANRFFRKLFEFADFVRGAETVEEVHERNAALVRGGIGDESEVVGFLNGTAREHRPTAGTGRHDVGVIAEDGERVGRDATRGDMEDGRGLFAGDLEHVRDHEQETLRGGEGARQSARLQRAVNRARCARFTLHFDNLRHDAEEVLLAFGRPFVGKFAHG